MSDWDDLSAPSALPDVARDVPLGYCWFCRRRIDVSAETWRPLPNDLMAHVDCETLWSASPLVVARRDYEDDDGVDLGTYFEDLEIFVRDLHPARGRRYVTEPRLQDALDARVEQMCQDAETRLLGPDNPWRRPGEDDQAYLRRVVLDDDDKDHEKDEP